MYLPSIKVYVRIRPLVVGSTPTDCPINTHAGHLPIQHHAPNTMSMTHGQKTDHFTYDFVGDADNTTQESVFYAVGRPITDNCMQGYNGTIFAYGQTGSGKTFTMQGPVDESTGGIEYDRRGVIPRCFEYLFSQIAREEKKVLSDISPIFLYHRIPYNICVELRSVRYTTNLYTICWTLQHQHARFAKI